MAANVVSRTEEPSQSGQGGTGAAGAVSLYPDPPLKYIQRYSTENIQRGEAFLPPPIPSSSTYSMFGRSFSTADEVIQSLDNQGIKRLFPTSNYDKKTELTKLNHSVFANFLDLLEILIRYPSSPQRDQKLADLEVVFINIHHLINEYRPHQARETLRLMLEMQQEERARITDRFQKFYEVVSSNLKTCMSSIPADRGLSSDLSDKVAAILGEGLDEPGTRTTNGSATCPGSSAPNEDVMESLCSDADNMLHKQLK